MALATVQDVQDRMFRDLAPDEASAAGTLLEDAEDEIRSRLPNLDDLIASGALTERTVVRVESNMVVRVLRNPEGIVQEGDGDYYRTLSASVAGDTGLHLTDQEARALGIHRGAFTIRPALAFPKGW